MSNIICIDVRTCYSISYGCRDGAATSGFDCQSWGWWLESRLCQIHKTSSTSFQPLIDWFFGSTPKHEGPLYHNNILATIKIHLCPSHIRQVKKLLHLVSVDVLRNAFLQVTLAVPEVVDTENWNPSNLSCFDPSSIIIIVLVSVYSRYCSCCTYYYCNRKYKCCILLHNKSKCLHQHRIPFPSNKQLFVSFPSNEAIFVEL